MKILNYGSLNIDYVYKVDHILQKGETQASASRQIFAGGKGLNQSVALGRAGAPVWHAGCIGTDGSFLMKLLTEAGVNCDYLRVLTDTPSGHTVIQNSRDGDNCILLYGGANRQVTKEQIEDTLQSFSAGDYLVLQNEISSLPFLVEQAHEKGMHIVLNPSPMDDTIRALKPDHIDYLLLNEIEAAQLTGTAFDEEDPEPLIRALRERFPKVRIVLTLGSAGSVYFDAKELIRQKAFPVRAVDTTAAGDTFTGYFLAGITEGRSVQKSLEMASKAASITVTRPGAAPSIPTREEIEKI